MISYLLPTQKGNSASHLNRIEIHTQLYEFKRKNQLTGKLTHVSQYQRLT